ncbi:MAG: KamA family radical SAM protein [candidate division Zixibacteria bacterium]|nr:KamA family radical SAM protein [candidate division Zixibacteria bacterium]
MSTQNKNIAPLRKNPRYISSLRKIPQLTEEERSRLHVVTENYAFRANEYYLRLIDWSDPNDPIRRIVIPHERELEVWGDLDASLEHKVTVRKGLQHKYGTTVLLLLTKICSSFCRFCFRKRLFMDNTKEEICDINESLEYIRKHTEVDNVLLSGGDPLMLKTSKLEKIIEALRQIDHIRMIRIGSKIPAYNPYRILNDDSLLAMLKKYSLPDKRIYLMTHFDHPRELTPEAREAIRRVMDSGVICLNQNPIIRGVSDSPEIMAELWNELAYMGVAQYYVFQGRPVVGNVAYEVPIVEAYHAIEKAKLHCSGLAKRIKYVMSHESGKIEIIGVDNRHIYLKYHRAKDESDNQRILICHRDDNAYWLNELKLIDSYENKFFDDDSGHVGYV